MPLALEWDEPKRRTTLEARGLDFADAASVFAGRCLTLEDDRRDYGETRYQTVGRLGQAVVMVVWTPRPQARRIISMRLCDGRERTRYFTFAGG